MSFQVLPSAVASTALVVSGYESLTRNFGPMYRMRGIVIREITGTFDPIDAADVDGIIDVDFAILWRVIFITRSRGVGSMDTIAGLRTGLYG